VAVNYRSDSAAAEQVVAELRSRGSDAVGVAGDVSREEDVLALFDALESRFEHVLVLVNSAGARRDGLSMQLTDDDWQAVIDTNLTGAFRTTRRALLPMIRARWGRIINISSVVGLMGNPGQTNYAASKAGIIGFTKALALEIGSRNITVNAIAPGFVQTAMTVALADDTRKALEGRIALKRLGVPDDVAYAAVFLASEQAGYITGAVLNVSGGLYT
jgi:3-oxoacyl-[acyl-carrier protein] reductase